MWCTWGTKSAIDHLESSHSLPCQDFENTMPTLSHLVLSHAHALPTLCCLPPLPNYHANQFYKYPHFHTSPHTFLLILSYTKLWRQSSQLLHSPRPKPPLALHFIHSLRFLPPKHHLLNHFCIHSSISFFEALKICGFALVSFFILTP